MSLERYWEKRDFRKTPEPRGKMAKPGERLSYFVQRHDARRLHYDFRLELDGTLKSWVIPKGPSLDPKDKRLAVHVEDHPLSYGPFEGEIPEGEYGAGSVLLWDRGYWTCEGDPAAGYRKGHLKFRLDGEKLSGGWALVRMGKAADHNENWLMIKENDAYSTSGPQANITELRPESVADHAGDTPRSKSGAKAAKRPQSVKRSQKRVVGQHAAGLDRIEHAEKAGMPAMLRPQLATLVERAPSGEDWLSKVKFDGYHALCRVEKSSAGLFTRAGNDWTRRWNAIADAAARLPLEQAWLDGEVVALTDAGTISFQLLQNVARRGDSARLAYYVFDLLYLDGYDLRAVALHERKRLLKTLLEHGEPSGPLKYSDHIQGNAPEVFAHVPERHTWGASRPYLDLPDRMIFDLDPAPDVAWPQVVQGAQLVKVLLDEIGLASFVKTTGGKGVHIVVPLKPEKPWDQVKSFSRAIAEHMSRTLPALFTANLSKKKRTGKIFIDYLRNDLEATAVAAYSTRARLNVRH